MPLVIVNIEDKRRALSEDMRELIERVATATVETEGVETNVEVDITITGNDEIRQLNRKFRNKDAATDVLSFPLLDFDIPGIIDADEFDFDGDKLPLGDIVISCERARAQAEEYGHGLGRELGFLTAHAMLHLLGYDHRTPQEEAVMILKQEAVLQGLGLVR